MEFLRMIFDECLLPFFKKYEKLIVGLAAVAAVVALFLTFYQIKETKEQIRASFSYQLHKDGREISKNISKEIRTFIQATNTQNDFSDNLKREAENKIRELLMYYVSAYHQWRYDNINQQEWFVIKDEFCNFLHYKNVKTYWDKRIAKNKLWNEQFREIGNQCSKKSEDANEK